MIANIAAKKMNPIAFGKVINTIYENSQKHRNFGT